MSETPKLGPNPGAPRRDVRRARLLTELRGLIAEHEGRDTVAEATDTNGTDALQRARARIVETLRDHRATSTQNIHTRQYKNPIREGYDRGLTAALAIIDAQIGEDQ